MKRLVRSRSPRDRSQYCRGLHTSGSETTASARKQCSARERRPVRTGSNLCLSTLSSQRISIPPSWPSQTIRGTRTRDKGSLPKTRTTCSQPRRRACTNKQTIQKMLPRRKGKVQIQKLVTRCHKARCTEVSHPQRCSQSPQRCNPNVSHATRA